MGNTRFKSSTNRAPRKFTKGTQGEEFTIWLQLKTIADIGIIGLPNAGKSSLLASVTNANPKIANYQFTTLNPNLGVASYCLLYTSPSPRDKRQSRMPSSA